MIRLAAPRFTRNDLERLWPALESGQLVQGKSVLAFEEACATRLGVAESVAVSSGTAALHVALEALELTADDEVLVPAFTWPSAANLAERMGLRVKLVDIDPETLSVSPSALAEARTGRTHCAVVIHQFGYPLERVHVESALEGLPIIEDAACAFAATDHAGNLCGTWGSVGCYSFHPRKGLTTGEGGLVVSADPERTQRLRLLRNHGQATTDTGRDFVLPGFNYRLNEVAAILGLCQLERFDGELRSRRALATRYLERLESCAGAHVPAGARHPGHAQQTFVVALGEGIDRADVIGRMRERGVECNLASFALHLQTYCRNKYGFDDDDFPVARWAHEKLMALPLHGQMTHDDVDTVVNTLEDVLHG